MGVMQGICVRRRLRVEGGRPLRGGGILHGGSSTDIKLCGGTSPIMQLDQGK
jgi:hypothetical protein